MGQGEGYGGNIIGKGYKAQKPSKKKREKKEKKTIT